MQCVLNLTFLILIFFCCSGCKTPNKHPYITTQTPITLLSSNDGEINQIFQKTVEQTTDWELKTKDSFTVINLGPNHPPEIKTIYDTVPAFIMGTPSMAMSLNGRFGLIANHGWRPPDFKKIQLPEGPRTNSEITPEMLESDKFTAQYVNMISLIDLSIENYPVVHRVLLDDFPIHILRHPDGERFFVGASKFFYIFKIVDSKLIEISRSPQSYGMPHFWITPNGHNLIATQAVSDVPLIPGESGKMRIPQVHWYSINGNKVSHLNEVKINDNLNTKFLPDTAILRVSLDGKMALICQRANNSGKDFSDILIADLTLEKPEINSFIEDAADGIESFAFHPNGKMAVATGLGTYHNCIVVLDIASKPARLLYTLDAKGISQGIEFTPEGDKMFVGSAITGRIEVFDVLGDYEIRKNPKFLNVGFGHNSLSIGPRYQTK
jgi:hypothetical protein